MPPTATDPTPTASRYLADALQAYEVDTVFLVPTVLSSTLVEMERRTGIARIVTHGEKAAAYMADGFARATGRLGVCMAQNIGAANLAAGLRDAYLGGSPVLALTGGPYEHSRGRRFYQEIEDLPLFKPVTRSSAQVSRADRLPDLLAQAVRTATASPPGPVHLELAGHTGDVLESQPLEAEVLPVSHRVPGPRPAPDPDAVRRAAETIARARRPVLVRGGGARGSGAGAAALALAELLDAPIATSLNAKSLVPADHPLAIGVPGLYARASANEVVLESDLVVFLGSGTGSQVTLSWTVPDAATPVVQIDVDPRELGRHYPHVVGVQSDARLGAEALCEALAGREVAVERGWSDRARALGRRWRETQPHLEVRDDVDGDMHPVRLCAELSRHLPDDALVVSDTGHAGMWTGGYLDLGPGHDYVRAAGSLGWALPASIGAQLGRPDRPVVCFTGDGGLWYHVAELETAARWRVPVTIVVNDNRSLNQEINPYTKAYGGRLHGRHHELWHFADVDLAAVATSMGVRSRRVTRPGQLQGALDEARSTPGPFLIDVVTDIEAVAPKGRAVRAG